MNQNIQKNFQSLDIRVGRIIDASIFKEAKKPSYKLLIDFGEEIGIKKSSAQITNYQIEDLINKKCVAVVNLGVKQIGPYVSECLVLGSTDCKNKILLIEPSVDSMPGEKLANLNF